MARTVIILASLVFIGVLVWAFSTGAGFDLAAFTTDPWVATASADLIFGFILLAVVIAWNEPSPVRAALWIVPIFIVGNLVPALYLLLNGRKMVERLRGSEETP